MSVTDSEYQAALKVL